MGQWIEEYDELGNRTLVYFLDMNDQPCINDEEIAGWKSQYNGKNQEIRREFFDIDGQSCALGGDNPYTGWEKSYHENGKVAKQTFFFTIKPYKNVLGKQVLEFDEHGNMTSSYYLDMDDQPCLCDGGYTRTTWEYDEQGNQTKETYYDINGREITLYVSVVGVLPDSNGEKCGIQEGDFLILYDGQPVERMSEFIEKRSNETGDDAHELVVLRDKEFVMIQIHPGKLGCVLGPRAPSEDQQKLILEKLEEVKKDK